MSTASSYIEAGRYKKVLLIGADKMSSILDYTDRATCIIFGDGAGAVLFEPNNEGLGLQDEYLRSDRVLVENFLRLKLVDLYYPLLRIPLRIRNILFFKMGRLYLNLLCPTWPMWLRKS